MSAPDPTTSEAAILATRVLELHRGGGSDLEVAAAGVKLAKVVAGEEAPRTTKARRILELVDAHALEPSAQTAAIHISCNGAGRWRYVMADGSVLVRQRIDGYPDEWMAEEPPAP